jgi:hypothetical protein
MTRRPESATPRHAPVRCRPFTERHTIIRARTASAMAAINDNDALLPDG